MADFQPRRPALVAALVFIAAGLTLFWPILTGQFLAGPVSDMYVAGYGFRLFGAEHFRAYGEIPQWNPYIFGGMPFIAAMHGDVFYPTAWLRWVLPVDTAINLGLALHIVLAGCTMYAFLRALGVSWGGALAGGLSWELSGIVAGLVAPGHDGKLFVAAITPLLFLAVLRAVRDRRLSAIGMIAISVGLSLHGHPQLSYYLLFAAGLWGVWLVFLAPQRPAAPERLRLILGALAGVALGFGLYAIQAMPFYEYIPFSPRSEGGQSGGWDYATAYSLPISELFSLVMPEFNGIQQDYWGPNPLKHHTEYFGLFPLALAILGLADRKRRPVILALGAIGLLFLLIALGRHTPFYRLWYEVMPMMKKVRAPGMAYFLVAFPLAAFAGFGAERLLNGEVTFRKALIPVAVLGSLGLLGVLGVLQSVAQAIALPERIDAAIQNGPAIREGGLRLLALTALALGVIWAVGIGQLRAAGAAAAIAFVVVADLWSVERRFFQFQPPASVTYGDDEVTSAVAKTPLPYRLLNANVYHGSWLMAHRIPELLGYHGNELRFFDELLGGKNVWQHLGIPTVWNLYAVRYLVTPQPIDARGWKPVVGPVPSSSGLPAYLYEMEVPPSWVNVLPAAAKVPEDQLVPTLLDQRFPADRVVLFPDTASVTPAAIGDTVPAPSPVQATLTDWRPGRMTIGLAGQAASPQWLVVSENWYPDWRARVDGREIPTHRGQFALITVELPPGAREVTLEFRSGAYATGRMVTLISLALALGLLVIPAIRERRRAHA